MTSEKQEQEFSITIKPTTEMWTATINGAEVPLRVWEGRTAKGQKIVAHVLSIVPEPATEVTGCILALQLPEFMQRSRDAFEIEVEE